MESGLASLVLRIAHAVRASWLDSRIRSFAVAAASEWRSLDSAAARRAAGWTMTVAAVTSLLVGWLGAGRGEPVTRVLPMAAAAAGLVLCWLGRPQINRSLVNKTGRQNP